jgi:hypothetical protein
MAHELLFVRRMATNRAHAPDLVTLASLHAALDGIVEIEALFAQIYLPVHNVRTANRLSLLTTEMRGLLVDLLRADRE